MSNEAYDRLVDNARDRAVAEAEARGITDDDEIDALAQQYLEEAVERWE